FVRRRCRAVGLVVARHTPELEQRRCTPRRSAAMTRCAWYCGGEATDMLGGRPVPGSFVGAVSTLTMRAPWCRCMGCSVGLPARILGGHAVLRTRTSCFFGSSGINLGHGAPPRTEAAPELARLARTIGTQHGSHRKCPSCGQRVPRGSRRGVV